ncbi:MAG: peptidase U32 family protein [Gammaproteobacteria bacterium]|nr:MAG: peptidase U32 family protein [Gammaproteobacteria bacterium]
MIANKKKIELVCPAGNLPALKAAVDNGADCVYLGFRDGTNARNFPGLGFDNKELSRAIDYAHNKGRKVLMAINTYPRPHQWHQWCQAIDRSASHNVDALILADPGLMHYAARTYPDLRLHLSVQGSATNHEAIDFYARHYAIRRVVLPRVLSLSQIKQVIKNTDVEVEVFGFGSLCVMVEGRCTLSSYVTGKSPNSNGVCSPAEAVRWEETPQGRRSRLNGVLIDEYASDERAGYPTLCKGRYIVNNNIFYAIEEPTSLNILEILPQLIQAGVVAIKVEGRQRSPAYVASVTHVLREALDRCMTDPDTFRVQPAWMAQLDKVAEGACHTLGAYHRPWQ